MPLLVVCRCLSRLMRHHFLGWWTCQLVSESYRLAGVLQGDTLAPYLSISCLDNVLRTSIDEIKENGFKLTKKINRKYPAKNNNRRRLCRWLSASGKCTRPSLLHSLERATVGIGLHVNAHKTEYMCFNQTGDIIGPAVRVFANGPGDLGSIPGRVIPKTLKMELDTTLLNTQHYKVRFKGKVEQSREWSSALPYTLV